MGIPARMRLSALTDGLVWPDSISEIVALATPARFANARCESSCRSLTMRNRNPTSISIDSPISRPVFKVLNIQ